MSPPPRLRSLIEDPSSANDFLIASFCRAAGAASGIDLDSDLLIELSEHPNCFGAKLTCAGIGKGHRLAQHTQSPEYVARHGPFQVLPGFSDYLLPALVSRQTGCITGTGNVFPKLIVKLYKTAVEAIKTGDAGKMQEALKLQDQGEFSARSSELGHER